MNYRIASILAAEAANTATTKTMDVNLAAPISRIVIQFKGTNNGSVPTAHPAKMVSKIELVDGSNVLFSLSGVQAQALNFYETGRMPTSVLDYRNDVMAIATFELNFGRWLWDPELALDPSKFNNPQLKITHNKAAGGSSPDVGELSVFAFVFDKKTITPIGFLMAKEQFNYTLNPSASEHIDLATDMPYRFLAMQSLTAGKQPHENMSVIKLSEDNDAAVVINNERISNLCKLLTTFPSFSEHVMALDLDTSPVHYCTPTYNTGITGLGMDTFNGSLMVLQSYGGSFTPTGDADEHVQFLVNGTIPHAMVAIPLGNQNAIEDWYDVTKIGSLRLSITAGSSASGTCQIISQQIRKF